MMRRKALTLTEVLTGLSILSILAGVMTLNSATVGQQTARREAERVVAFFRSHILRANRTHDVVWFTVDVDETPNSIEAKIGTDQDSPLKTDKLEAREKCSFSTSTKKLVYNKDNQGTYNTIPANASVDIDSGTGGYSLTVNGADGKSCAVRISK